MKRTTFMSLAVSTAMSLCVFSAQAQQLACTLANVKGNWAYSEHGTQVYGIDSKPLPYPGVAFAEVGQFTLKSDGTGMGVAFLSVNGTALTPSGSPGIPLVITGITLDPHTCTGVGTFLVPDPQGEMHQRTITFVIASGFTEFNYISTTGDITTIGTAKRQLITLTPLTP